MVTQRPKRRPRYSQSAHRCASWSLTHFHNVQNACPAWHLLLRTCAFTASFCNGIALNSSCSYQAWPREVQASGQPGDTAWDEADCAERELEELHAELIETLEQVRTAAVFWWPAPAAI